MVLNTGRSGRVWAVAFHPDGKHVLGGNDNGIQRWQLSDGQEVGKKTEVDLQAISGGLYVGLCMGEMCGTGSCKNRLSTWRA